MNRQYLNIFLQKKNYTIQEKNKNEVKHYIGFSRIELHINYFINFMILL